MKEMMRIAVAVSLLFAMPLLHADDDCGDGSETHWNQVSKTSQESGRPIMMVFSSNDCGYCVRLKDELIEPGLKEGALQKRVLVREFNIDSSGKVEDFDGLPVRSRSFVSRYDIFATPTVLIVDPQGKRLSDPIVGYDNLEEYSERLDRAIEGATEALRGQRPAVAKPQAEEQPTIG
jgi:thioredoxin-related protein